MLSRLVIGRFITSIGYKHWSTEISRSNLSVPSPELSPSFHEHLHKVKMKLSKGLPIIHHPGYVCEFPARHRFAMKKFSGVFRYLKQDNVISSKQVLQPEPVPKDVCCLVHSEKYISDFFNGNLAREAIRRGGFPWTEGVVSRCRLETGGTLLAGEVALETGLACSTGGGTHHAFPDFGAGFCMINDLAVTTQYLLHKRKVKKVLIVDLDVHQGDGTAFIFQNEPNVFTFSMHSERNFPFTKQRSSLDIGLEDHIQDETYLQILKDRLPSVMDAFRPDLVLYDAGVDPHVRDELGKLDLTDKGLYDRDSYVINQCLSQGIPCVTVIGGGYCRDINELSLRHSIVHRVASKSIFMDLRLNVGEVDRDYQNKKNQACKD